MGIGGVAEIVKQYAIIESLEARQLLAAMYAADYMPLVTGTQWTYATVEDGTKGTERVSVSPPRFRINGVSTRRVLSDDSDGSSDWTQMSFSGGGALLQHMENVARREVGWAVHLFASANDGPGDARAGQEVQEHGRGNRCRWGISLAGKHHLYVHAGAG